MLAYNGFPIHNNDLLHLTFADSGGQPVTVLWHVPEDYLEVWAETSDSDPQVWDIAQHESGLLIGDSDYNFPEAIRHALPGESITAIPAGWVQFDPQDLREGERIIVVDDLDTYADPRPSRPEYRIELTANEENYDPDYPEDIEEGNLPLGGDNLFYRQA